MYGKLINNILHYAPKNYTTESGNLIVNFNQNEELLKEYGYKKVTNNKPDYDRNTQTVRVDGYDENETDIVINYIVVDRDLTDSIENRVIALEDGMSAMTSIVKEEVNR